MKNIILFGLLLFSEVALCQTELPIGSVIAFAGDTATLSKGDWVLCDGRPLNISDYLELFKSIKWTYGYGNDTANRNYFSVPDYRGVFLRGADLGSGHDPDDSTRVLSFNQDVISGGNVGSMQTDAMQKHKHDDKGHTHPTTATKTGGEVQSDNSGERAAPPNTPQGEVLTGNADLGDPTDSKTGAGKPKLSTETRPINISVYWIIKAR